MKNVTITLDEDVARWVRIHSAKEDMSISRLVGELLMDGCADRLFSTGDRLHAPLNGGSPGTSEVRPCAGDLPLPCITGISLGESIPRSQE